MKLAWGLTVVFCLLMSSLAVGKPAAPPPRLPEGTKLQIYADNLDFPVDMAWVPRTKTIFFTEKNTGQIRILRGGRLLKAPCATLEVDSQAERGLLGIVLHPDFGTNGHLYVYYSNRSPLEHRVTRFKVEGDRCRAPKNIVTGLPTASAYHNGGQLEFLDGKLFVSTGEGHRPRDAQNTENRLGKILRYNPDGSIPEDNPFGAKNPVWSYGHRNPFGLAANPATGRLYETENGPECDDEVNLIEPGQNYGWGNPHDCGSDGTGPRPVAALIRWTPTIVPTDPWWYRGKLRSLSNSLYMGDFNDGHLHRLVMNAKGTRITEDRIVLEAGEGIVDVTKGPGGWLYLATPSTIFRIVKS